MFRTVIVEILRTRMPEWWRPQELADQAFVGLWQVSDAIHDLRQSGYEIEDHPRLGYRLLGTGRRLIPYEITRGLGTTVIGHKVLAFERVASTNDLAWAQASSEESEGIVVCAEEQTAGRGRMGRRWMCPPGKGLLLSTVLRPRLDISRQSVLTVMAAVAVARAIHDCCHLPALIRWPNDIIVRSRKAGGILVEARTLPNGPAFVVGIGLNTGIRPEEFPAELRLTATSLSTEMGRDVDRLECARAILRSLDRWYRALQCEEYAGIVEDWRRLSSTLGQRVVLADGVQEYRGRVVDLTLADGLILRLDSGATRVFPPTHVTLKQEGDISP